VGLCSNIAFVSESPSPSYEELAAENAQLREAVGQRDALIVRLESRLAELEARVAELEARLGRNSLLTELPDLFLQFR
jgi:uncharacterized protein YceH (UPF0502 family)